MARPRICVVGASNLDLISYVPRLPAVGETLHGSRFQIGFGGKGANQAVMAAKLGAAVVMVTKLGRDPFGENTLTNFQRWGIDTRHVAFTDRAFTGVAPIAVDAEGRNAIIVVTRANDMLTVEEIEAAREEIRAADVLVCQLEVPLAVSLAALRLAREDRVRTVFNPAPAQAELPEEVYALTDVLCPNERETELLTGRPVGTIEEAEQAARWLLDHGPRAVILTLGERGSVLVTPTERLYLPAVPVRAVDTTGAGDAFVGSLAFFLAAGKPLADAMGRANHIAALSVQAAGTQSSFPEAASLPADLLR